MHRRSRLRRCRRGRGRSCAARRGNRTSVRSGFTAYRVRSGFVTAWRRAICPTRRLPSPVNATTDGVVRLPIVGNDERVAVFDDGHTEFVVPRSIPIARVVDILDARSLWGEGRCTARGGYGDWVQSGPRPLGPGIPLRPPTRSCRGAKGSDSLRRQRLRGRHPARHRRLRALRASRRAHPLGRRFRRPRRWGTARLEHRSQGRSTPSPVRRVAGAR